MSIEQWDFSESAPLAELYNVHAAEIPYEYPVDQENFVESITCPTENLTEEVLLVAVEGSQPRGYIHVGMIPNDDSSEKRGLIRFLVFPRDRRATGQALLDHAHEYLRGLGASAFQAFNYGFGYPCTWYGHLKSPWEHIYALLGSNGYRVEELSYLGKPGWGLVMVWPDFEISEPVISDKALEVQVDDTPFWPHLTSYGDLPTVAVRVFRNGEQVGGNETRPYYLPHWGQVPQNMCYTVGMGVNETERGRGIGRYLMERSLFEMQRLGCRYAILDVDSGNYTALMLYTSMGYRTIYSVCQMLKTLEPTEAIGR